MLDSINSIDSINRLTELFTEYQTLLLPLGILISLGLCFAGFRFIRGWVSAFGFLFGFGAGYIVSSRMIAESTVTPLWIGLLCGVICTLLSFLIFKAGIFVLCAVLAGSLAADLSVMDQVRALELPGTLGAKLAAALPAILTLVIALAAGFLAVKVMRMVIIVITGAAGAYRAVMYFMLLQGTQLTEETRTIWIGIIVLLALLGIVVQIFTAPKE